MNEPVSETVQAPPASVRPYLAFFSTLRVHGRPQVTEHAIVIYAYDASDARAQALLALPKGTIECLGQSNLGAVRPAVTDEERAWLEHARQLMPAVGGYGYCVSLPVR